MYDNTRTSFCTLLFLVEFNKGLLEVTDVEGGEKSVFEKYENGWELRKAEGQREIVHMDRNTGKDRK